ncbi:SDR family oxidoreductase [Actinomadura sp. GTD37]|uniref:SDR family oxidoreductase n=1 Tax=Actinomadura sp. GTD37 TaxID=1778030 RepID=UPI0035BFE3CB
MTTPGSPDGRDLRLHGQTVVLVGGSAGIGRETARLARTEGAEVVLTGRDPGRLRDAAADVGASGTAAFDATDPERLRRFFAELPRVDHVMVTAGGNYYARLADLDFAEAQRQVDEHLWLPIRIALAVAGRMPDGGSLVFMGGTGARRPALGLAVSSPLTVALPALTAVLALEVAPIRVNLIAAGFVDTPLSARLLGDQLEQRREQLRATLPIGRVVQPGDVAALAVHLMTNTALTGGTYDIDGGQQALPSPGG